MVGHHTVTRFIDLEKLGRHYQHRTLNITEQVFDKAGGWLFPNRVNVSCLLMITRSANMLSCLKVAQGDVFIAVDGKGIPGFIASLLETAGCFIFFVCLFFIQLFQDLR